MKTWGNATITFSTYECTSLSMTAFSERQGQVTDKWNSLVREKKNNHTTETYV